MSSLINICALISISCLTSSRKDMKRVQIKIRSEESGQTKIYQSINFLFGFSYPATWTKNINYIERYDGEGGFFQVAGIASMGKDIDQVVEQEINHQFKPFGNNPEVIKLMVEGQAARIIMPSIDQNKAFKNAAAFIVKLKQPVTIGDYVYDYIIIWADKNHIQAIAESFNFTKAR